MVPDPCGAGKPPCLLMIAEGLQAEVAAFMGRILATFPPADTPLWPSERK